MPNLPEDFDPEKWRIVTSPGSFPGIKTIHVVHRPSGSKSEKFTFDETVVRGKAGQAMLKQQVNRMISYLDAQIKATATDYQRGAAELYEREFARAKFEVEQFDPNYPYDKDRDNPRTKEVIAYSQNLDGTIKKGPPAPKEVNFIPKFPPEKYLYQSVQEAVADAMAGNVETFPANPRNGQPYRQPKTNALFQWITAVRRWVLVPEGDEQFEVEQATAMAKVWRDERGQFTKPDERKRPKSKQWTEREQAAMEKLIADSKSRPLMSIGAPKKYTRTKSGSPEPGTFYLDPSGQEFVYDGAMWFPIGNGATDDKPANGNRNGTQAAPTTNNTETAHKKRKFNFD